MLTFKTVWGGGYKNYLIETKIATISPQKTMQQMVLPQYLKAFNLNLKAP